MDDENLGKKFMVKEIKFKIVGYEVVKVDQFVVELKKFENNVVYMYESVECLEMLLGFIYKIKIFLLDYVLYIIINDIILNEGIEYEQCRLFEIFINFKNMENFQWVLVLICVIFVVFCKGGDSIFLVEEMKVVFDFKGGYFKWGGKFMFLLVVEIGEVIEIYMQMIGMIKSELDEYQKVFIEKKKQELKQVKKFEMLYVEEESFFFEGVSLCGKCSIKLVVYMDGCMICLSCGDFKCG